MKGSTVAAIALVGGGYLLLTRNGGLAGLFGSSPTLQGLTTRLPVAPQPSTSQALLSTIGNTVGSLLASLTGRTSGQSGVSFGGGSGSAPPIGSSPRTTSTAGGATSSGAPSLSFLPTSPALLGPTTFAPDGSVANYADPSAAWMLGLPVDLSGDANNVDLAQLDPSSFLTNTGFEDFGSSAIYGPADLSAYADNVSGSL